MTQFIELTTSIENEKILINLKDIKHIYKSNSEPNANSFVATNHVRYKQGGWFVKETYEEIKEIMKYTLINEEHEL